MLTACASTPAFNLLRSDAQSSVEYLASAMTASSERRETMWRDARRDKHSADADFRRALMQSVPGHSGHDPDKARKRLQAYAQGSASSENAALARLRVAELKTEAQCNASAEALQQRLDKIVEIERTLDNDGYGKKSNPAGR